MSILLIRAKKDPSIWIFPKGHIDPGETPEETALRETREEAGVDGEVVGPRVGHPIEFDNGREFVRVEYFLVEAQSEWADCEGREQRWFSIDDAIGAVEFDTAKQLLREAKARLTSPGSP